MFTSIPPNLLYTTRVVLVLSVIFKSIFTTPFSGKEKATFHYFNVLICVISGPIYNRSPVLLAPPLQRFPPHSTPTLMLEGTLLILFRFEDPTWTRVLITPLGLQQSALGHGTFPRPYTDSLFCDLKAFGLTLLNNFFILPPSQDSYKHSMKQGVPSLNALQTI